MMEDVVTALALSRRKALVDLRREDFEADRFAGELLRKTGREPAELAEQTRASVTGKIRKVEMRADAGKLLGLTDQHS